MALWILTSADERHKMVWITLYALEIYGLQCVLWKDIYKINTIYHIEYLWLQLRLLLFQLYNECKMC